jgi:hypothetical protein
MSTTTTRYGIEKPTNRATIETVACNYCGAFPGKPCQTTGGAYIAPHADRTSRAWSAAINRAYIDRTHAAAADAEEEGTRRQDEGEAFLHEHFESITGRDY